jgi:hypothetical protein
MNSDGFIGKNSSLLKIGAIYGDRASSPWMAFVELIHPIIEGFIYRFDKISSDLKKSGIQPKCSKFF